eukprot:2974239-Pyramimonas_sp.AAC.1
MSLKCFSLNLRPRRMLQPAICSHACWGVRSRSEWLCGTRTSGRGGGCAGVSGSSCQGSPRSGPG